MPKYVKRKIKPERIVLHWDSQCEGCGKDLKEGHKAWRYLDVTGCTRKCAIGEADFQAHIETMHGDGSDAPHNELSRAGAAKLKFIADELELL